MRIPLNSGAYQAKSIIANAQKSINIYPETNPEDTSPPAQTTQYLMFGYSLLVSPSYPERCRALYRATNNELFAVIGEGVYFVDANFSLTLLGSIAAGNNPVSMVDNSIDILLVDGTDQGYVINLATHAWSVMNDSDFFGGDRVDFNGGYFVLNKPGTNEWYCSESFSTNFNGTDIAEKIGGADPIQTLIVHHNEVWLLGLFTSETWGGLDNTPDFPFARLPGAFMDHGCVAKYSLCEADAFIYWVGQDSQGQGIIYRGTNYQAQRISTYAIEQEIQSYPTLTDAIGYTFQKDGHTFVVFIFPRADRTWVYDVSTNQWFQWASIDINGNLHRHRSNCYAFAYGKNIIGDYQNGNLYVLESDEFTDNGTAIVRIRSFPHIVNDGKRVSYRSFIADMEVGDIPVGVTADITLRYSDDRGKTFSGAIVQTMGGTGEYLTSIKWGPLGMARDRIFELSWSGAFKTALQGAWVEVVEHGS